LGDVSHDASEPRNRETDVDLWRRELNEHAGAESVRRLPLADHGAEVLDRMVAPEAVEGTVAIVAAISVRDGRREWMRLVDDEVPDSPRVRDRRIDRGALDDRRVQDLRGLE